LQVSAAHLEKHAEDLDYLRNLATELRKEVQEIPNLVAKLTKWLENLRPGLPADDYEGARLAFQAWLKLYGSRRETHKLFMATQARLTSYSGIDALSEVALAREKTMATGKAKLDLKREEAQGQGPAGGMIEAKPGSRDDIFDVSPAEGWGDMGEI
jgi:hypothetical protein